MIAMDIQLPPHIPSACVAQAAEDYRVPAIFLLAIIKQESKGDPGAIGYNKDGSIDVGAAQLNSRSWIPYFQKKYGIPPEALTEICQAVRAQAYALKKESMRPSCGGDFWCAVGWYHSSDPALKQKYIRLVQAAMDGIVKRGKF